MPFVAVRQQHDESRALAPLVIGCHEELIDDDLRAVDKVAELGFPQRQHFWTFDGVAVLEAERRVLAEQRVVDPELGVVSVLSQRNKLITILIVDEGGVSM